VLDLDGTFPYLKDNRTGSIIEPRDYMDFENIYAPNETYKLTQTAQGRNYHLIKAFDFANYFQSDYWHYSNEDDLVQSAQPVADPKKCSQELDWLESQLNSSSDTLYQPGQQHINLMALVDSFGHPEASTYYGHGYWLGSYYECTKTSINRRQYRLEECINGKAESRDECLRAQVPSHEDESETIKFRYCIGKAHERGWPSPKQDRYVPRISYKVGICLPETCETLTHRTRADQLERLMRINMPSYMKDRVYLHDLYCLPDSRSPIRQLPLSARVYLGLVGLWLATMLSATITYSAYKRHQRDLRQILLASESRHNSIEPVPLDGLESVEDKPYDLSEQVATTQNVAEQNRTNSTKLLSHMQSQKTMDVQQNLLNDYREKTSSCPVIVENGHKVAMKSDGDSNHRSTFSESELSKASYDSSTIGYWLSESPTTIKVFRALSIVENLHQFRQPPKILEETEARRLVRVNLNALDSIKCLCCILVIFGHIIFIHHMHLSNIIHTIELSYELAPRALIGFFNFVDTFFIISGMLTAYFVFKRFNKRSFSNPMIWVSISILRLLRLSPVYILVFWFIKSVGVYIGEGPIWDYGTDKNSIKGLCINDHWWKSILYVGNLGTMQPLCILPAWSIIVDSQYSLVIPVILFLIFRNKKLGYLLLFVATILSTSKMSLQLAGQTAVKTSDMAKVRLHVYPLISRFAAEFYNTAWNRIGPVAIGIFGGHMLYLYDVGRIKQWPAFMRGTWFRFVLALHILILTLPMIGRFTDDPAQSGDTNTTIFILSNATIKPIWSLINTIFLLRLITDLRSHSVLARLMSHNIWHCLGKLCFTSYLIHYEIILTLLKSRPEGLIDPNWSNALREFSAVFLISTVISFFIYILYEAPMNSLITLVFAKHAEAVKSNKTAKPDEKVQYTSPADDLNEKEPNSYPFEYPISGAGRRQQSATSDEGNSFSAAKKRSTGGVAHQLLGAAGKEAASGLVELESGMQRTFRQEFDGCPALGNSEIRRSNASGVVSGDVSRDPLPVKSSLVVH